MPFPSTHAAFGRKPHDPSWLATVPAHRFGAAGPAPATLMRPELVWTPSLVQNNVLPTCAVAALINSARVWCLLRGYDLVVDEAKLLAFYARVYPCADTVAAIAQTDGLQLQQVLEAAQQGWFDVGEQAPLIPLFRALDPTDPAALRDAIHQVDSAYIGLTLWTVDIQPGAVWIGDTSNAGQPAEGHSVLPMRYNETLFFDATWGQEIDMDDAFYASRCDEAFAITWTLQTAPVT